MSMLPLALIMLGVLLPPAHATAPLATFTNGHMSPRNRQPGEEQDIPIVRERLTRTTTAATPHQEFMAVVEQTTPWGDHGGDLLEADQVTEVVAEVVEEPNPIETKTHEELIAEEWQRREEELQSRTEEETRRAEEQGRREAELKLRAEEGMRREAELKRREDELKRRADAEVLVQQELERRAAAEILVQQELEARQKAAAALSTTADPLSEDGLLSEPDVEHQEEFFRPQSGGRGGFRPSRFHTDETLPEDARNKRHEELQLNEHNQTSDDIEMRQQEEARKHMENLSRQEEIEIEHLDSGLAHEAAGVDQHQHEAYEHDRINQEREDMINKQEMDRQSLEKEMERIEEIRKIQEMERVQRENEEIIQEENQKRKVNMNVHTNPRSDSQDWEAHNGSSATSCSGWALLLFVVLSNIRSYFVC